MVWLWLFEGMFGCVKVFVRWNDLFCNVLEWFYVCGNVVVDVVVVVCVCDVMWMICIDDVM